MYEEHIPLESLDIVGTGETSALEQLTIKVVAKQVKLTESGIVPNNPNAWCYVRSGSVSEHAAVLDNFLGPILNVSRGQPLKVAWINALSSMAPENPGEASSLEMPPINPLPMDLAIPQLRSMNWSAGIVTHLHGGKVAPESDGWPLQPASFEGNSFGLPSHRIYLYPNEQRAAMLWFHDHGMDNTAPQVHAGLAGLYFVRDESDAELFQLIGSPSQEIPLVIQDRWLTEDGGHFDYWKGIPLKNNNTEFDRPEFLGETIFVNGRPWPHAHVHPLIYRLRILNGSNARTYALALADKDGKDNGKIWYSGLLTAIGNDAGLFAQTTRLSDVDYLLIAPGERLDVLLDLSQVDPAIISELYLVNLAVKAVPAKGSNDPEPIFSTDDESVTAPTDTADASALSTLPQASILQFRVRTENHSGMRQNNAQLDTSLLAKILKRYANDEAFHWDTNTEKLERNRNAGPIAKNRLVVLMNNTGGLVGLNPLTGGPWRDTQIWEMLPSKSPSGSKEVFAIPFDAKLADPKSRGVVLQGSVDYEVSRAWFFEPEDPATPHSPRHTDPLWGTVTENSNPDSYPPRFKFPHLYRENPAAGRNIIKPMEGTYERWYVANIGNDFSKLPDMHPFHMHLVNFVVTRRFVLAESQSKPGEYMFVERDNKSAPIRPLDFDGKVRHDTVRIQSNELVELLVYFPKGYTGRYPYHCHLVEHEDMGMMLHFEVQRG
ncbi:MAG: multicopper oxidase domain-containing protein [Methylococcales bacterium]|nr:multicopper oxidase domain-containing protein [Methylococcales bacterium]